MRRPIQILNILRKTFLTMVNNKGSFTLCIFSDCNCHCDSFCHNQWVAQDSMEVLALCDCDNITRSCAAHCKQKQIAIANRTV